MIPFPLGFWIKPPQISGADFVEDFEGTLNATMYTSGAGATYGTSNVYSGASKELYIHPQQNGYPATLRLNDISPVGPNFEAEWDQSQCSDNTHSANGVGSGFVARTTNWQNPSSFGCFHWGLCVYIHRDGTLVLGRSSNSSATVGITPIATAASGLGEYGSGADTPRRKMAHIKWRAVGDSHKVWVNGVLKIDTTSSYFETNSGYVAFFTTQYAWTGLGSGVPGVNQGYPALFDNLVIKNL
jgi:hypothetical protein